MIYPSRKWATANPRKRTPLEERRAKALLEFRVSYALPPEKRAFMALWLGDPTVRDLERVERSNTRRRKPCYRCKHPVRHHREGLVIPVCESCRPTPGVAQW